MTGQEFGKIFDDKWDKAYSAFIDSTKKNRLIKEAMYRLVSSIYDNTDTQREADELGFGLTKNEKAIPAGNKLTVERLVNTYLHLLRMAFVFDELLSYTIVDGVVTVPGHSVRKGDTIICKVDGSPDAEYTVGKVRGSKIYITGYTHVEADALYLRTKTEASPLEPDRKKGPTTIGDKFSPRYELTADISGINPRTFVLYPTPSYVLIDYLSAPPVDIDVDDTVEELEDYYTLKFMYRLLDECIRLGGERTRDMGTLQIATKAIIDNP
jgi:hypothetical protein